MRTEILSSPTGSVSLREASSVQRMVVAPMRQFDSRTLFGSAQEVRIEHFGQEYRLRRTRSGKLILTK